MKRRIWSVTGLAVLALILAACASTDTQRNDTAGTSMSSSTGASTDAMSGAGAGATSGASTSATASVVPNSTVSSIIIMQKPADSTSASEAVGGSGTSGSMGTGAGANMGSKQSYRITLIMDDGRTQVLTQDWAPSFANGDRVRFSNGVISR